MKRNLKKLSEIFIRRIYARGKINTKDLTNWVVGLIDLILKPIEKMQSKCQSCGKNEYISYWTIDTKIREKMDKKIWELGLSQNFGDDNYLFVLEGFTSVIYHHYNNGLICPIIENDKEKEIVNDWISNSGIIKEDYYDWDSWDILKWKFCEGGRKKYLDKQISHDNIIELFK